jgi:hypothetical protein
MRGLVLLALIVVGGSASPGTAAAQAAGSAPPLALNWDAAAGYRATLRVGPVLAGSQLEDAARGGLPIRIRMRVELWRDRFFDQLVDSVSWSSVIVYEPLGEQYFVRSLPGSAGARRFASFAAARTAIEAEYPLPLRPTTAGRYYYSGTLQIETLSISDLDELERWLQGELQPAVRGQRAVPSAVGQGARRLLLRLLDLPQRRIDVRTGRFTVP